ATVQSVTTVRFENGAAYGTSTDGAGFLAALAAAGLQRVAAAVILGAGGAARAVAAALAESGAEVAIAARSPERGRVAAAMVRMVADGVARQPDVAAVTWDEAALGKALAVSDLLVNATPVGAEADARSPVPDGVVLHRGLAVFDLVYRPRTTPLLASAVQSGCRAVEGVE